MYPSHPLNASITIRINENAHFLTVTCYMIPEALTIIRLCLWQQISASLNTENPGTERQAFFSLSKCIEDMNHQCECVAPCKLSKEKLLPDTKFDNVRVRSYPWIRTPNKPHAGLDRQSLFWQCSVDNEWLRSTGNCQLNKLTATWRICPASEFRDFRPPKTLHA